MSKAMINNANWNCRLTQIITESRLKIGFENKFNALLRVVAAEASALAAKIRRKGQSRYRTPKAAEDLSKRLKLFFCKNEWPGRVIAFTIIAAMAGTGILIKVSNKSKYNAYLNRRTAARAYFDQAHINQTGNSMQDGCFAAAGGFIGRVDDIFDRSQTPAGFRGVQPVGYMPDGRPVFDRMPVYDEVDCAFVAHIFLPGPDPRFPGMPTALEVPPKGAARNRFIREQKKLHADMLVQQRMYCISDEYRREQLQGDIGKEEYRRKMFDERQREHRRQLDLSAKRFYHMNDNQLRHFRSGWKPVVKPVGGLQYGTPDLMVSPGGGEVRRIW
jgi:hypothetical protein